MGELVQPNPSLCEFDRTVDMDSVGGMDIPLLGSSLDRPN